MCQECGCGNVKEIEIDSSVLEANNKVARANQDSLNDIHVFCINITGSPGSGKTSLIELLVKEFGHEKIAVIEGDLASDVDTKRLASLGVEAYQINTHSGCHLQAHMIQDAISHLNLEGKEYLLIENVGNLVCPAGVPLGQHMDIVLSSTPEGVDKPTKYPVLFHHADLVVISKFNLAEAVDFDIQYYTDNLRAVNPKVKILPVEKDGEQLAALIAHWRQHAFELAHEH